MQIQVNGEPLEVEQGCSLSSLIKLQGLEGQRVALEVNGELVVRSQHQAYRLRPDDRVEIVQAIGGG